MKVVTAYSPYSNPSPILIFLVAVVSSLSCIPASFAWFYSPHHPGTVNDTDFYQLLTRSVIQMLNVLIIITPLISNARLINQAWPWTWSLAGSSIICAVAAVPLYLSVPVEWISLVLFLGSLAQTLVTLSLVVAIRFDPQS